MGYVAISDVRVSSSVIAMNASGWIPVRSSAISTRRRYVNSPAVREPVERLLPEPCELRDFMRARRPVL